jgi:hypothetical protein
VSPLRLHRPPSPVLAPSADLRWVTYDDLPGLGVDGGVLRLARAALAALAELRDLPSTPSGRAGAGIRRRWA